MEITNKEATILYNYYLEQKNLLSKKLIRVRSSFNQVSKELTEVNHRLEELRSFMDSRIEELKDE